MMTKEQIYEDVRTILNECGLHYYCHSNCKEFFLHNPGHDFNTIVEIYTTTVHNVYLVIYNLHNKKQFQTIPLKIDNNQLKLFYEQNEIP